MDDFKIGTLNTNPSPTIYEPDELDGGPRITDVIRKIQSDIIDNKSIDNGPSKF